jgi:hypothetical protein
MNQELGPQGTPLSSLIFTASHPFYNTKRSTKHLIPITPRIMHVQIATMFGLGSKIESLESTKTLPRVPLTKDQWVPELARHFKPEFQLRLAIWGLLFEKLVERNVFEDDESERGMYNLVGNLDVRNLEKAHEEVKESLAAKPFAEWVEMIRLHDGR